MKKNLISIVLLVGAVTLNLSMLSNSSLAGCHDRQGNAVHAARAAAPQGNSGFCAARSSGQEVKAGSASGAQHGCGVEGPGVHLDFNFVVAAVELAPRNHAQQPIPTASPVFTDAALVPQDRPPRLSA